MISKHRSYRDGIAGALAAIALSIAGAAHAQDRPFVFSVSTPESEKPGASITYDTGFGERPFDVSVNPGRLEQRVGLEATFANRFTLLAGVGRSADNTDTRLSQRAELVVRVLDPSRVGVSVAAGGGIRHESAGIDVLVARAIAGRAFGRWHLQGNLVFEKPLSSGRDPVDLVTTLGWTRSVTRAVWVGVEAVGEDLEGFWDRTEAEGGARLLAGPSLRLAPPSAKWQLSVAGGPVIRATSSPRTSGAERTLPLQQSRAGFAVRTSVRYAF